MENLFTGASNKNANHYIYLENTFVCTEHNQAFMEVDGIRIVYDFELECIIGWYNPNVGVEKG